MGLLERKIDPEKKPEPEQDQRPVLLDASQMFTRHALPMREVEFRGADGTEGKVLVQALSMRELDEINEVQGQPVTDARGNVIKEADQIGWDAKVISKALRNPNKTRVAGEHWQALAEQIMDTWLPGTIRAIRTVVLELSGFGGRSEQKKDS